MSVLSSSLEEGVPWEYAGTGRRKGVAFSVHGSLCSPSTQQNGRQFHRSAEWGEEKLKEETSVELSWGEKAQTYIISGKRKYEGECDELRLAGWCWRGISLIPPWRKKNPWGHTRMSLIQRYNFPCGPLLVLFPLTSAKWQAVPWISQTGRGTSSTGGLLRVVREGEMVQAYIIWGKNDLTCCLVIYKADQNP